MSESDLMKAAYIEQPGGADAIKFGDLPVPHPHATDVVIQMEASEVNHVDTFVRSGAFSTPLTFPFIIGRDIVGTIVAVGDAVEQFKEGDRVWANSLGHEGRQGTFAEYVVAPADRVYPLPDGVEPAEAAAILHAAGTAHIGLVREARLHPGETIVVGSASGAVGSAIVELASTMGAFVIAGASTDDEELVAERGANVVLDKHDNFVKRVEKLAPKGIDVWWDPNGGENFGRVIPLLAPRARMIVMAGMQAEPQVPIGQLYTRDASIHGFAISNASVSDLAQAAVTINHMLAMGTLKARIGATFRLSEASKAHRAIESGKIHGRILVLP